MKISRYFRRIQAMSKFLRIIGLFGQLVIFAAACVAPFSDIQSARTLGPGRLEVTPSYSSVQYSSEGDFDHIQDHFGVQLGFGLIPSMDFRLRYELIDVNDSSINVFGFGPKVSLVKDSVAFYAPVGFAFGEDIETSRTWQVHPTLLFTISNDKSFEFNPSLKMLIPFQEGSEVSYAVNLGMGLSTDIKKWAVRPEVGILFYPEGEGFYMHLSIGFTYATSKFF